MKRLFDIILSSLFILLLSPLFLIIAFAIYFSTKSSALYWSKRIGLNNQLFLMPKFRSMRTDAPQVATHLLQNSIEYLTPIGIFLRKTSLDELPQLFSIIKGDMSFVGPRPALYNQDDLVEARTKLNIHSLTPGLTGWAQVNGRDELSIEDKVVLDHYYLINKNFLLDLKIIFITAKTALTQKNIRH